MTYHDVRDLQRTHRQSADAGLGTARYQAELQTFHQVALVGWGAAEEGEGGGGER